MSLMDREVSTEMQAPSGILTRLHLSILNNRDVEKVSVLTIETANGVTDQRLGLPNPTRECPTCGAKDLRSCEGHFGVIKFPFTILHPYFISETAQVLNKICPGCKFVRGEKSKEIDSRKRPLNSCKYCDPRMKTAYPRIKFKVSSKDLFGKTAIIAEVDESRSQNKKPGEALATDFWDIIPNDAQLAVDLIKSSRRVLSHAQVYYILKDVNPKLIKECVRRKSSLFLNSFLVTPNCHRVTEFAQQVTFDERTRAFKKLVDFRGTANELSTRVLEGLKTSKIRTEKPSTDTSASTASGLKHVKELILGKRSDHAFRMVIVGDPSLELSEIGVPRHIAERLQVSEHLNLWNCKKLQTCCDLRIIEKGEVHVRRNDCLISISSSDKLEIGDVVYRPLRDGDTVLINRPPSIHSHSFIALSVKQIPSKHSYSVLAMNPLICSPFRADFDGDCIHGYVPQSVDARIELQELVALDKQLVDAQSGRNLISFCQDSLAAAHLVVEDGVLLDVFQMQQLQMFCPQQLPFPAISKSPLKKSAYWTGKQLFSMLLPPDFNYKFPAEDDNITKGKFSSEDVKISKGELLFSSEGSSWLRDSDGNFFQHLFEHYQDKALGILYAAQEILCEWLSVRGLSVSLSDLYLSSDAYSRGSMMDEVSCGLQEAERVSHIKLLMVNSNLDFLIGDEESLDTVDYDVQRMCYEKQKSAALSQLSVSAFKKVFWDIQSLLYQYASRDNSLLAMLNAGSKGNLMKLVQHSMCLGLQHSLVPLPFSMPYQLSCAEWNRHKAKSLNQSFDDTECSGPYIPSAVVESSFLTGLNPLECFVHSVTSRSSAFSDNADLPGTLNRKLMFFMRDLYLGYDGTVRNSYGNHLVQFFYNVDVDASQNTAGSSKDGSSTKSLRASGAVGGQPVGSLAACAISEAAYSALDQPVSVLETSPLLNLKKALECGSKSKSGDKTASLFLSKKLGRQTYGFEYAALEVQSYLEELPFSDIVSSVMILFSPQNCGGTPTSPWVCHFHISKELTKKKRLRVRSIVDAICMEYNFISGKAKANLPKLQISSKVCSAAAVYKEENSTFCIAVTMTEFSKNLVEQLETLRDVVIPSLLGTVVKGFSEFKKVDILWKDQPNVSKLLRNASGELYLRVLMSNNLDRRKFWSSLVSSCLHIMDMIDWERSHPDDIHDVTSAYGIDTARKLLLSKLNSAISETGKKILPEHVCLTVDCLSATGEFVGLNARGLAHQRKETASCSPFSQACFSNPADCLIKAAKRGTTDELQGSLDALSWGKTPSIGTGGRFDILYSGQGFGVDKPKDIYKLLGGLASYEEQNVKVAAPPVMRNSKLDQHHPQAFTDISPKLFKSLKISKSVLIDWFSRNDILGLSRVLRNTLHNNPIEYRLNEVEKNCAMMALYFHPKRAEKIGPGTLEIKVGLHSVHESSRCFWLFRTDGTKEDFSYHKCIHHALEIIAPQRAKTYQSRWLNGKTKDSSDDCGIFSKL